MSKTNGFSFCEIKILIRRPPSHTHTLSSKGGFPKIGYSSEFIDVLFSMLVHMQIKNEMFFSEQMQISTIEDQTDITMI